MGEMQPLVHVDMYRPSPPGVERYNALMKSLTGEAGAEVTTGVLEGRFTRFNVPDELRARTNTHFLQALSDRLNITSDLNMRSFWRTSVGSALAAFDQLDRTFPSLGLEGLTEMGIITHDVSDTLAVVAAKGHDKEPAQSRKSRLLTGLVAAEIAADNQRHDLSGEASKIANVLLEYAFVNEDETKTHQFHAWHHPETNSVVPLRLDLPPEERVAPAGSVRKMHRLEVREVIVNNKRVKVAYLTGTKPPGSAVIKALSRPSKSAEHQGYVMPWDAVKDRVRLEMAIIQSETVMPDQVVTPSELQDHLRDILNSHYRPVRREINESRTNGYRDDEEAGRMGWIRKSYEMEGLAGLVECAVYTEEGFVNANVEVGRKDFKTGIYSGNARTLYEAIRSRNFLRLTKPRINPERAIAQRHEELVPWILSRGVYQPQVIDLSSLSK